MRALSTWPPSAEQWEEILRELPANKHEAVRARIEESVRNYFTDELEQSPRHECWQDLQDKLSSNVADLCEILKKTADADPANPERERLLHLAEEIDQVRRRAKDYVKLYGRRGRQNRLWTWLLIAWNRDGGGELSDSADGPLVRFFDAIAGLIFEQPIGGTTVRGIVKREKERRDGLVVREPVVLQGRRGLSADADD
jgi:hypothetical protein